MSTFSAALLDDFAAAGLDADDVARVVRMALREDLAFGADVTTQTTVPADLVVTADVVARSAGVIAGVPVAKAVLAMVDAHRFTLQVTRPDGDRIRVGDSVMTISGPARALLTAERVLLNLLTHLCGVATLTRSWVDEVAGTGAAVRDTRKTTPGLRLLEKYAVRCGGGTNHRFGLGDAALLKDNHLAAAGGIKPAVTALRGVAPDLPLEVECDDLQQVAEALEVGVSVVLLDNMTLDETRSAVAMASPGSGIQFEASGGLTLDRARDVAATGVHFLAVGALTHSASALDLGLDLRTVEWPTTAS